MLSVMNEIFGTLRPPRTTMAAKFGCRTLANDETCSAPIHDIRANCESPQQLIAVFTLPDYDNIDSIDNAVQGERFADIYRI